MRERRVRGGQSPDVPLAFPWGRGCDVRPTLFLPLLAWCSGGVVLEGARAGADNRLGVGVIVGVGSRRGVGGSI